MNGLKRKYRILLLGDREVGKTALMKCCLGMEKLPKLKMDEYSEIVEKDLDDMLFEIAEIKKEFNIEDISNKFFTSADAAIIVYDIGRRSTFVHLLDWIKRIEENNYSTIPIVIVGNKMDARNWPDDPVKHNEAMERVWQLSQIYGMEIPYFEISSYQGKQTRSILAKLIEMLTGTKEQVVA